MSTLLSPDQYDPFLPEDLRAAPRIDHHVGRAEQIVLDRYREPAYTPMAFRFSQTADAPVQLDGYAETASGTPDPDSMDDGLLFALRTVIAAVVQRELTAPDTDVKRYRQGEREVEYMQRAERPSSLYAPLRRYDQRTPWH
jgi:hypothetical protein